VTFDEIAALEQAKQLLNEAVVLPLVIPEFFVGIRCVEQLPRQQAFRHTIDRERRISGRSVRLQDLASREQKHGDSECLSIETPSAFLRTCFSFLLRSCLQRRVYCIVLYAQGAVEGCAALRSARNR
jgi:hypothetical protein